MSGLRSLKEAGQTWCTKNEKDVCQIRKIRQDTMICHDSAYEIINDCLGYHKVYAKLVQRVLTTKKEERSPTKNLFRTQLSEGRVILPLSGTQKKPTHERLARKCKCNMWWFACQQSLANGIIYTNVSNGIGNSVKFISRQNVKEHKLVFKTSYTLLVPEAGELFQPNSLQRLVNFVLIMPSTASGWRDFQGL